MGRSLLWAAAVMIGLLSCGGEEEAGQKGDVRSFKVVMVTDAAGLGDEAGYRAGVLTVNRLEGREVKVLSVSIGDFNNPAKGKSLAQALLGRGADILFQLAGNTGLGLTVFPD